MGVKGRVCAAAIVCIMGGSFDIALVGPVAAQGYFQGWFQAPSYRRQYDPYRTPYTARRYRDRYDGRRFSNGAWWGLGPREPAPQIRVSSPRYYTYEPDAPIAASFAELAETRTASAAPLGRPEDSNAFAGAPDFLASFKLRVLPEVAEALKAHYRRYPELIWVSDGALNDRARSAIAVLARAGRYGLVPDDYIVDPPAPAGGANPDRALIGFELELSAKVLTYALDATRGRIDPNKISGYHDFARKEVDLAGALVRLAAERDAGAYIETRNPDGRHFKALVEELARLRDASSQTVPVEIAPGTFLKPGASDPELANVVEAIRRFGSPSVKEAHAETLEAYSGGPVYTPELVALVRDFQRDAGLRPDGIVGKNTIRALIPDSPAAKIRKVELAMERARWLPGDLGARHVFINQPAYTATYMEEGADPLSMRIVVGQKSNQTYFFMDQVEIVEYNPYWGVPRSIIVNEMMPRLYADPTYLDRLGYEVTTVSGRRVSSSSVDWYGVANKTVSVDVRQPPGSGNALGRVKILFPNAHAIYMHDTPQKNLFERDARAFSHGCVRLQRPREMAAAVLGKPVDYIDGRIAEGRNEQEELTEPIPVYVSYFTAWPAPDGFVEYFDDVYERDMYLSRALARTTEIRHAEG